MNESITTTKLVVFNNLTSRPRELETKNPIKKNKVKEKRPIQHSLLARSVLAAGLVAFAGSDASAVVTSYSDGDLFLGFRKTGNANTLAVNIGSATRFLTPTLGGTAVANQTFNVQFGVVPNTSTAVFSLDADLTATFGSNWASNPTDGSGVRWGVVGFTSNAVNNSPIDGYAARTLFVTRQRVNPSTQTSINSTPLSAIGNRSGFATQFNGFANGIGGGSYINQESTSNSSVAYIGAASDTNNWGTRIQANGGFGLGASNSVEQLPSGTFSGPTNSVLDLWLSPNTGSTLATGNTYLGSFSLNNTGELQFTAVPEPSTYALIGIASAAGILRLLRRRKHLTIQS